MARWTPRARRPLRRSSLASWSVASTLSVISSISWSGSRPEASMAPATSSSRSGCWSWRTDRLTLRNGWGWRGKRRCQSRAAWQAACRTQRPMGTIRPVSSARETNSPGMTRPRSGWSQRTSASSPASLPPGQLDHRLVADGELLADDGPAQGGLEVEALHGPGVHGRVEHPDPGPAGRLGRVHGHVGVAQQPLAKGDRLALVGDPGDEHGELVAAEAGGHVVLAPATPHPL